MDAGGVYSKYINGISPNIQIVSYEIKDGKVNLINPENATVDITPDDILKQKVQIPLNIAVRNIGKQQLDLVRIEFAYDNNLDVISAGKVKIDPENRVLVYEHDLGTLESMDYFTPIQTVDVIQVPFAINVIPTFAYLKYDVPVYYLAIASSGSEDRFVDKEVVFNIRVFAKDRPTIEGTIKIILKASLNRVGLPTEDANAKHVDVQQDDIDFFSHVPTENATTLDYWEKYDDLKGFTVKYYKVKQDKKVSQYIIIDDKIRRVIVDNDSDGWIDFDMYDINLDNIPDDKIVYDPQKIYMPDWKPSAIW